MIVGSNNPLIVSTGGGASGDSAVWTLTTAQAFTGGVPSASVSEGDYGVLAASSGPVVLRYKAACAVSESAGGGTRPAWMTPYAYDGAPTLQAWTGGNEDNEALEGQGWTIAVDAGCSVAPTGGMLRISSPATFTGARIRAAVGEILSNTRVECLFEARSSVGASNTLTIAPLIGDGTNATCARQGAATGFGFGAIGFNTPPAMTPSRNGAFSGLPALASSPAIVLVRDEGRSVFSTLDMDGRSVGDYRRDITSDSNNFVQFSANGSTSGACALDFRGYVITY